jgi:hypothetical protein
VCRRPIVRDADRVDAGEVCGKRAEGAAEVLAVEFLGGVRQVGGGVGDVTELPKAVVTVGRVVCSVGGDDVGVGVRREKVGRRGFDGVGV